MNEDNNAGPVRSDDGGDIPFRAVMGMVVLTYDPSTGPCRAPDPGPRRESQSN